MNVVATCCLLLLLGLLIVFVHVVDAVVDLVVDKVGLSAAAAVVMAVGGLEVVAGGPGLKYVQKQERCRNLVVFLCPVERNAEEGKRRTVSWLFSCCSFIS